jgi:hypothetical protein
MTLTFLDLYNECAGQPWSMFDNDAESVEDFESAMKISINKAISYIWNCKPWSFRNSKRSFTTEPGVASYNHPDGILTKKVIGGSTKYGVKHNGKYLDYEPDFEMLDEATGKPESFYLDDEPVIYLYPTPDDKYNIDLTYLRAPFGVNETGEDLYELKEDTDYIDIDEKYESIFKNCVISLAMIYAIADESDENHSGYKRQYDDAMSTLIEYCNSPINDKRITW